MKKRRIITVISVLLVVTLLFFVIFTVAKYITKEGKQSKLTSQNFYFSSNFLKSDKVPPVYEIYGNTVTFQVRNYVDDMRINDSETIYTATATEGNLKKADETVINANTELTLSGGTKSSCSITLTYDFASDELEKEITVSVTGTGDFTQILKAKFIFIKKEGLRYEIKDQENRDYAELYIYTGNTASNVTINWDNTKLLIDETNDYVFKGTLNSYKNSVKINNIDADTTVKTVFLKKDISQDYTCGITKSDGTININ